MLGTDCEIRAYLHVALPMGVKNFCGAIYTIKIKNN
jgi:hypothetical protein